MRPLAATAPGQVAVTMAIDVTVLLPLQGSPGAYGAAALLKLLTAWMHDHSSAVQQFLSHPPHLPLLADMVGQQHASADLQTASHLACLLLGVCLAHHPASSPAAGGVGGRVGGLESVQPPPPHALLDAIISRMGVGQFVAGLTELQQQPWIVAAAAGVSCSSSEEAASGPTAGAASANGHAGSGGVGGSSDVGVGSSGLNPIDASFARHVPVLCSSATKCVMELLARPQSPALNMDGALSVAAGAPVSAAQLASSAPAALPHGGQTSAPPSASASSAGNGHHVQAEPTAQLVARIAQLQSEVSTLQSRNAALLHQSAAAGGSSTSTGDGSASLQVEREARVAAELRASRAEMEVATVNCQLQGLQQSIQKLEADLAGSKEAATEARTLAEKAEAELTALSGAYNSLEEHAFKLEEQCQGLQSQQADGIAAGVAAAEGAVQRRSDAAAAATGTSPAGEEASGDFVHAVEVDRRVSEAVAAARLQSDQEGEESLTDLLVCLGQEEEKVAALAARLQALGEDVGQLLGGIGEEEEDNDGLR